MAEELPTVPGPLPPTTAEKAATWAKAVSLFAAAAIAVYAAAFKGEPGADEAKARVDKTWNEMQREVRRLTRSYKALHLRVLTFQAREEGLTSGALLAKLEALQRQLDAKHKKGYGGGGSGAGYGMGSGRLSKKIKKASPKKPVVKAAKALPAPPWHRHKRK